VHKQKEQAQADSGLSNPTLAIEIDPRYRAMACYNCGEPGHFMGICTKSKICFICTVPRHYMSDCPCWKLEKSTATFLGSAGSGLGFYHIDLPKIEMTRWLNINNCGVVVIKKGTISMSELEKEMSDIFCKEWPWQIRELTPAKFLMRFPPHRRVEDIKNLPSFNLRKEGVQVEVTEWIGDLDHFSELVEVWVQFEGIPPRWCEWKVFAQMVSGFGLLLDVDWSALFKSFYEKIRVKIACRNPRKIPGERLFELDKKLYLVTILVECFESKDADGEADDNDNGDDDDDDDDDKKDEEDGASDDDYDDLDDLDDRMEIEMNPKSASSGLQQMGGVSGQSNQ
jgi:hypothetical protein